MSTALGGVAAVVVLFAVYRGFVHGGQDFRVFHYAAGLVLEGRWDALYLEGPDRYLYAPGFALLTSPLGILPANVALALWLLASVAAFLAAMRALGKRVGFVPVYLGSFVAVRPLLIDLRYGQVNLFILAAAVFATIAWFERNDSRESRRRLLGAWFLFSIVAFAKIYPLALFLFPLIAFSLPALAGGAFGALILLVPPTFVPGVYPAWLDALARKGLPTDTHNQSLLAFLTRVFGGEPFYALGMGGQAIRFSGTTLSLSATRGIWILFSVLALGTLVVIAYRRSRESDRTFLVAGLGIALCFLPAHLIWKSYFVLGIPLYAALFSEAAHDRAFRRRMLLGGVGAGIFLAGSSGDVIGPRAAAWVESLAPFLWVHLAAVVTGLVRLFSRAPDFPPRSA